MVIDENIIRYYKQKKGFAPLSDKEFFCNICEKYLSLVKDRETDIIGSFEYIRKVLYESKNTDAGKYILMLKHPISYVRRSLQLAISMQISWLLDNINT